MGNELSKDGKLSRRSSRKTGTVKSRHSRTASNPESLLSQTSGKLTTDDSQVLHVHLNNASGHLALKRSPSGHLQLRLPDDDQGGEVLPMSAEEISDLNLLEDIGLGLEFSPGDAFIGQLTLEVVEVTHIKSTISGVYVTVADEHDKTEPKFATACEDCRAWWGDAKFSFIVLFSNSVLTLTLKGRSTVLGSSKHLIGKAYLPVTLLQQGSQEFELDVEGSRPGKVSGRLKVRAKYQWLRGTEDDGTYTKVNRLVLHKTSRIARSAAAMATLENISQVNHALLSHDNMWAVLSAHGEGRDGGEEGDVGLDSNLHHADTTLGSVTSDVEQLTMEAANLAAAAPVMPSASSSVRLQSALSLDEGPSGISQHAAAALLESLAQQAREEDTQAIVGLKRSLMVVLCPLLERLDGLERKTQALQTALQERMYMTEAEELLHEYEERAAASTGTENAPQTAVQRSGASTRALEKKAANPVEPFISGLFEYGMGRPAKKRTVFMFMRKGHWAQHPVMPPSFLGTLRTDSNGRLGPMPVPHSVATTAGHYEYVGLLPDDYSYAKGSLFMLRPGTRAVVFDLDGTITVGDSQVVTQFMVDALGASTALNAKLSHKYDLRPRRHALHAVRAWAAKGYQVIYLSGRQGSYYNLTLAWLIKHRYPPGPIHLTRTHLPTLPVYFSVGLFKVKYMESLRAKGIDVYAAYGNTPTDIKAYEAAGIAKERTWIIGPFAGKNGSQKVTNWTDHIPEILALPDAPVPIPYTELLITEMPGYIKSKTVVGKDGKQHDVRVVSTLPQRSASENQVLEASESFAPSIQDNENTVVDTLDGILEDSDDEPEGSSSSILTDSVS